MRVQGFVVSMSLLLINFHKNFDKKYIRQEELWGNKWITNAKGTLQNLDWAKRGIGVVHDLCHGMEARLLSHLQEKFYVRCTFLDMLAIRLRIPLRRRESLSGDWIAPPPPRFSR